MGAITSHPGDAGMMRFRVVLCLLCCLAAPSLAQATVWIAVKNGDVAALVAAIQTANESPADESTVIRVSGDFHFAAGDLLPAITSDVYIQGAARFIGAGYENVSIAGDQDGPERLFHIRAGASLKLDNVELTNFSLNHGSAGLIVNEGSLLMRQSQISDSRGESLCISFAGCAPMMPAILNRAGAELTLNQTSIVNSGFVVGFAFTGNFLSNRGHASIRNSQVFLSHDAWTDPIVNSGKLELRRVSLLNTVAQGTYTPDLFETFDKGSTSVSNSAISGFSGSLCENAESRGHNLVDAQDCQWSAEGDLVGVAAGLLWRPVDASWDYGLILKHALVPMAASPAIDASDCGENPSSSLLGGIRPKGTDCDIGAVEAWKIGLGQGGINGVYYDPDADGHYVNVIQTDYVTLVTWATFDADGNPAWVYGTGHLVDDHSVIADAFINRANGTGPGDPAFQVESERWGTLEVEMTSCDEGIVAYHSEDPGFGSGQFSIRRLANVRQLGCVD